MIHINGTKISYHKERNIEMNKVITFFRLIAEILKEIDARTDIMPFIRDHCFLNYDYDYDDDEEDTGHLGVISMIGTAFVLFAVWLSVVAILIIV